MAGHYGDILKSHFDPDPVKKYCVDHSYKLHPAQHKLIEATLNHPQANMLGGTEVIQTCTCFIKQMKGKNALDIGMFTGFSALSWALAIPDDGRVVTMDTEDEDYKAYGKKIVEEAGVAHKVDVRVQPALKTLDELIAAGESGTFDFAFLDADKKEYTQYYEKCLQLLRPGGLIAIDNALWGGKVAKPEADDPAERKRVNAIKHVNDLISNDNRVNNVLLPIGDGLHLAFKK